MSTTPVTPSGAPAGISDVVSQADLTTWAQIAGVLRYMTAPLSPAPAPTIASPVAPTVTGSVFTNMFASLAGAGVDNAIAHVNAGQTAKVVGAVGYWTAAIIQFCMLFVGDALNIVLGVLDGVRKGLDPQVGELSVTVLNEFLGTDFGQTQLPMGLGTGDHLTRARAIGALLYSQLESEFAPAGGGTIVPNTAPAQTFSGLAINFGLASGIMGVIGGMVPLAHMDELRELGEEVAQNIGLGRLVRRALQPLIQILVANPLTWAINTKYTPTQFPEALLVNPFLATSLPTDQLYNAMHLLGYSNDKISAFIAMHQKRLAPSEVKLLVDNAQWTQSQADTYVATLGWPTSLQPTVQLIEELREERAWISKLVDELNTELKAGRLTIDEFTNVVNGLPYSQPTKAIILGTAAYKSKALHAARPHQLSGGELFYLFAAGLIDATDLETRWTAQGLSQADADLRLQLWLLHLNRLHELETTKQQAYQEKVAKFILQKAVPVTAPAKQSYPPAPPLPPVPPFPLG